MFYNIFVWNAENERIGILNFKGETAPWRWAEPEISRNETAILHSAVSLWPKSLLYTQFITYT